MEPTPLLLTPATPTSSPTKWWIKATATTSPSILLGSTASIEAKTSNCSELSPSTLRTRIFAYVSLKPPLPNHLRAGASLSSELLGQIEPGAGLKIIDGPICADGYSWWLVESLDKRLRGWTAEGRNPQRWLMPCPNAYMQCSFPATPTPPKASTPNNNPANTTEKTCKSNKLAVGLFAQVDPDSLLVIRAERSVGAVIGHAGPMSIVKIMNGPSCVGDTIWWKVDALEVGLIGWTTENDLEPCPKDSNRINLDPS